MNRVAFQGEPGAFSEEAAVQCCGKDALLLPRRSFNDVIHAILTGTAERGVLPVENSLIGTVAGAQEAVEAEGLAFEKELWLPIHHCLMTRKDIELDAVTRVLSHPAALAQCANFFAQHPHMAPVEYYDTAGAAKHVATFKEPDVAAIASRRAADRYKLRILLENIEDRSDNRTRFVVLVRAQ